MSSFHHPNRLDGALADVEDKRGLVHGIQANLDPGLLREDVDAMSFVPQMLPPSILLPT